MSNIGPGWSGIVRKEDIVPLATAIEEQFAGKLFSTMFHSIVSKSHFTQRAEALFASHQQIDEIKSFPESSHPFIWIIVKNQWSIHTGVSVYLTEKGLFIEKVYSNGFTTWCWILER